MKRVISMLVMMTMVLAMTACGSKEPTSTTFRMETEESGIVMTDTMTLEAEGDIIKKMTEVLEMDLSALDDATIEQVVLIYDELAKQCQEIEGVECTTESGDKTYTLSFVVDMESGAVPQLSELGLLEIDGDAEGEMSLEATEESLTASGYEKVEE